MSTMPFDPHVVGSGDSEFDDSPDLSLPDDLACLADQLREDAQRLAADYPPGSGVAAVRYTPTRRSRIGRLRFVASVAAVLFVLAVGGLAARGWSRSAGQGNEVAESTDDTWPKSNPAAVPGGKMAEDAAVPFIEFKNGQPMPGAFLPAVFQPLDDFPHDVSVPELEAVIDLMEQENEGRPRLSI
jgi:hypothetical protein